MRSPPRPKEAIGTGEHRVDNLSHESAVIISKTAAVVNKKLTAIYAVCYTIMYLFRSKGRLHRTVLPAPPRAGV